MPEMRSKVHTNIRDFHVFFFFSDMVWTCVSMDTSLRDWKITVRCIYECFMSISIYFCKGGR